MFIILNRKDSKEYDLVNILQVCTYTSCVCKIVNLYHPNDTITFSERKLSRTSKTVHVVTFLLSSDNALFQFDLFPHQSVHSLLSLCRGRCFFTTRLRRREGFPRAVTPPFKFCLLLRTTRGPDQDWVAGLAPFSVNVAASNVFSWTFETR